MQRKRRVAAVVIIALAAVWWYAYQLPSQQSPTSTVSHSTNASSGTVASVALDTLLVKGRAPKTNYTRAQFGDGWTTTNGCDTRNIILNRDMREVTIDESCHVTKGTLDDPYTGHVIAFARGGDTSDAVQIDHVVALSNAWQTGAQLLAKDKRIALANDPLELLAVDGPANQAKGDSDAATWLPPHVAFRCQYVARQIAVKVKYSLWVTSAEKQAMQRILAGCPDQRLPTK